MRKTHFKFFCENLYGKSSFSKIPPMSKTKSKKLINALFASYKQKNKKFRIICLVGGIDCKGKHFKIGNVHFFDGRKYQFGEGKIFDSSPGAPISLNENFRSIFEVYEKEKFGKNTLEQKRNSGRAYVDIQAPDSHSAINIAKIEILKAFDDSTQIFKNNYRIPTPNKPR